MSASARPSCAARRLRRRHGRRAGRRRRADHAARRASTSRPFRSASPACRSPSARPRASSAPRSSPRPKKGIADGTVDIVVGTHALLGSAISFKSLGLLIVDEEQHFGVKHKERLKELKSDVHVLHASPPRPSRAPCQLALTGVRELSLIATPPVDRLAVRTFISPFDPLVIRETLLRERYRGGQSFYVVPRISDLAEIARFPSRNPCRS